VPKLLSSGGTTRLCGMSRMGQDDSRKLLIVGAMSRIRWICRRGAMADNWLGRPLLRKPRMVVAVARGQQDGTDHLGDGHQATGLSNGVIRQSTCAIDGLRCGHSRPGQEDRLMV
jgi:hypothetical protein